MKPRITHTKFPIPTWWLSFRCHCARDRRRHRNVEAFDTWEGALAALTLAYQNGWVADA